MSEPRRPTSAGRERAEPRHAATEDEEQVPFGKQPCLQCGYPISDIAGSKAAICPNCGFKDPCC